jgi:hypothetical protein
MSKQSTIYCCNCGTRALIAASPSADPAARNRAAQHIGYMSIGSGYLCPACKEARKEALKASTGSVSRKGGA